MILPTISKHGTSKDELMSQLKDLKFQLEACKRQLSRSYPHSRDYSIAKELLEANREFNELYDNLDKVYNYVQARLEAVDLL